MKKTILTIVLMAITALAVQATCSLQYFAPGAGGNNTGSAVCAVVCPGDDTITIPCDSDLFENGSGAGVQIIP